MIVDDEPPIRKLLRMGLAAQGYEVIEAPNGKVALELLARKARPVLLDLGLPDIDGLELLRTNPAREERRARSSCCRAAATRPARSRRSISAPTTTSPSRSAWTSWWPACARRCAIGCRSRASGRCSAAAISRVDLVRRIVKVRDKEVKLSPKEYDILRLLVQHAGKVLTHKFLLRRGLGRVDRRRSICASTCASSGRRSRPTPTARDIS